MKRCKIIGYAPCTIKDTKEEMFRICVGVSIKSEKYIGLDTTHIFLPQDSKLEENLRKAYDNNLDVEYETTDDVINNKSKISSLIFE